MPVILKSLFGPYFEAEMFDDPVAARGVKAAHLLLYSYALPEKS
jgi:hypothetical protein